MRLETLMPPSMREKYLEKRYGKRFLTFSMDGQNYTVRRWLGAYPDGGFNGNLGIFNSKNEMYAGIIVDPWEETDEGISVCSKTEQSLDVVQASRQLDKGLRFRDKLLMVLFFGIGALGHNYADATNRTNEEHLDVLGRAVLEIVDQSPKPMHWYTYGHPVGMRDDHPNPLYERLMSKLSNPSHPFANKIRAYVEEEPADNIQRNYFYVVKKNFLGD